uniref:MYM-type domain-containing protein n=1 Tax=viral metagenome TaxID=1070528 RepID=A0A6C0M2H4_9ZZZZ
MPPKKSLQEAPVVFSLRLPVEEHAPTPAELSTNYSEILSAVETSKVSERFNTETLKDIFQRVKSPTYSGAACFWCCHGFSWKPCVLPISYDAFENMYQCEGHFCSPECGLAYLYGDVHVSDTTRWSRHALLVDLYRVLYSAKELTPAPNRSVLRMFGGPLNIEQFREYLTTSDELVSVQLPPIRLHVPSMNVQGPARDVKKFVPLSEDTVAKASKELRLRRTKPVHSAVATLDKCFG